MIGGVVVDPVVVACLSFVARVVNTFPPEKLALNFCSPFLVRLVLLR